MPEASGADRSQAQLRLGIPLLLHRRGDLEDNPSIRHRQEENPRRSDFCAQILSEACQSQYGKSDLHRKTYSLRKVTRMRNIARPGLEPGPAQGGATNRADRSGVGGLGGLIAVRQFGGQQLGQLGLPVASGDDIEDIAPGLRGDNRQNALIAESFASEGQFGGDRRRDGRALGLATQGQGTLRLVGEDIGIFAAFVGLDAPILLKDIDAPLERPSDAGTPLLGDLIDRDALGASRQSQNSDLSLFLVLRLLGGRLLGGRLLGGAALFGRLLGRGLLRVLGAAGLAAAGLFGGGRATLGVLHDCSPKRDFRKVLIQENFESFTSCSQHTQDYTKPIPLSTFFSGFS